MSSDLLAVATKRKTGGEPVFRADIDAGIRRKRGVLDSNVVLSAKVPTSAMSWERSSPKGIVRLTAVRRTREGCHIRTSSTGTYPPEDRWCESAGILARAHKDPKCRSVKVALVPGAMILGSMVPSRIAGFNGAISSGASRVRQGMGRRTG